MTLDQAVKVQQIIDKRAIRCDTQEFLNQKYYSKSRQEYIRYGDMHLDHFFRVFENSFNDDDLLQQIVEGFMNTLERKGKLKKITPLDVIMEEQINARDKKKDN